MKAAVRLVISDVARRRERETDYLLVLPDVCRLPCEARNRPTLMGGFPVKAGFCVNPGGLGSWLQAATGVTLAHPVVMGLLLLLGLALPGWPVAAKKHRPSRPSLSPPGVDFPSRENKPALQITFPVTSLDGQGSKPSRTASKFPIRCPRRPCSSTSVVRHVPSAHPDGL